MEEARIEMWRVRMLTGLNLNSDRISDEPSRQQIVDTVKAHHSERGMTMRQGTMVDATLIAAPSSTKNKEGKPFSEIYQTRNGNQWYHASRKASPTA